MISDFKNVYPKSSFNQNDLTEYGYSFFSKNSSKYLKRVEEAFIQSTKYLESYTDKKFVDKKGVAKHLANPHYHNEIFFKIINIAIEDILKLNFENKNLYITHSKISYKTPNYKTNWYPHQDNGYKKKPRKGFSAAIFLDDANEKNGSLELFPKSHLLGNLPHQIIKEDGGLEQLSIKKTVAGESHLLSAKRGDIAVWDFNTIHQSRDNYSNNFRFLYIFEIFEKEQNKIFLTLDEANRFPLLISGNNSSVKKIYSILHYSQKPYFLFKEFLKKCLRIIKNKFK
jgi:ectoine hydroxylase-related dioxygenase (phytanoyl-CoA dioxygenase family)